MENKKMWQALIRQMIIEFALLTLFYLFVGNNFGNNVHATMFEKIQEIVSKIVEWWSSKSPSITVFKEIFYLFTWIIAACLTIPLYILKLLIIFLPLWFPFAIIIFICLGTLRISAVKAFIGKPSETAIPAIQEWYKSKQKIYIAFVIISRVLFFVLLLFKAKNAPSHYSIFFALGSNLAMENGFIGKLIIIVGAVLLFTSAFIRIKNFIELKTYSYYFDKYVCPKCHCLGIKKLIKKERLKKAEYEKYETSSGYFAPEKTGELRDSAGNTIGDVYEDTWHDTSSIHSTMVSPAIWEYTYQWSTCHCIEHSEVKKNH